MSTAAPVLIAGGGPTGLYLALLLARTGLRTRVIERDRHPQLGSRGAGIHPRTMEIMHMLGVLPAIRRHSIASSTVTSYKMPIGDQVLKQWRFMEPEDPTPNFPIMEGTGIAQSMHTSILRDALAQHGVLVETGKTLRGFTQDAEGVTCDIATTEEDGSESQEEVRASFLCGADGARSAVRKLLGCTFIGETKETDAIIVADLSVQGLSRETNHMWSDKDQPGGLVIRMRPIDPHSDLMSLVLSGANFDLSTVDLHAPGAVQKLFKEHIRREDIVLGEPTWVSYFRPSMRMVDKFGEGRVFILGDAAHTHSPTGGQGLNSGVQDALNLFWKLALVSKSLAPFSLLRTFTTERLPVIAQMLNKTLALYKLALDPKNDPSKSSSLAQLRVKELLMLGVNYRWSPLVHDTRTPRGESEEELDALRAHAYGGHVVVEGEEAGAKVVAGDRAPDAPGLLDARAEAETAAPKRLFDIFDLKRHTVLLFAASSSLSAVAPALEALKKMQSIRAEEVQAVVILRQPVEPSSDANAESKLDYVLMDSEGHAYGGYGVDPNSNGPTIVVVRPDTYIGAIVKNDEEMAEYFGKVFSGGSS